MGTALFITIAVMTVIVAITAGLFARGRSLRVLVAGLGLALIPLALQLTGLSILLVNGIGSLVAWAQRTGWNDTMTWGAGLGATGVLLLVVSGFIPKRERAAAPKEPRAKAAQAGPRRPAVGASSSTTPDTGTPTGTPQAPQPARKAAPVDEDIDEIEAILKKRGIV
ncbi:hypothetical protein [Arachnia propionica]|uniref:hypothetical protein n=1 Tax=Arachnia propionica TaxID=1750 RepID=UPI00163A0478|nr:hypothetical protein [Arachnia propionica]MDO5084643.1 hypothetical protein [Arachnia propionica]